jgi:hypothetical protein
MELPHFAAAVTALIEDPELYARLSRQDLVVVEGVLTAIAKLAHEELARRDKAA